MTVAPLGDSAILVTLGDRIDSALSERTRSVAQTISDAALPWVTELVPGYASITVIIDPVAVHRGPGMKQCMRQLEALVAADKGRRTPEAARVVEIPVCYGGEFGADLTDVAARVSLSEDEVIQRHASASYTVGCIGFTPGFTYLIGLHASLAVPRKDVPQLEVPAGSVAIGGAQTGIYPQRSPGGWHIIGRTPLSLFNVNATPPALLQAGDRVRFIRISAEEYARHSS